MNQQFMRQLRRNFINYEKIANGNLNFYGTIYTSITLNLIYKHIVIIK